MFSFALTNTQVTSHLVNTDVQGSHRKCPYSIFGVSILSGSNLDKMCEGFLSPRTKQTVRYDEKSKFVKLKENGSLLLVVNKMAPTFDSEDNHSYESSSLRSTLT